ncbi:hypothetical protein RAC89_09810 [Paenibacillus sp. GD4]|uniref:hypothetical protein n=1 Tax=Paenibacillus sp. GD4 TaxID=3068890 RepID=UPI00279659DA|nr:hypothetical protein [Paenibacillus sp. GD4]MDQ1910769.1 hypothetical protein [Paenibacillus sp. GD4]
MSKRILMIVLLTAILSACGSKPSWDQEKVPAASAGQVQRLMADQVKAAWSLTDAGASEAGIGKRIRLEVKKSDGSPVDRFQVNHEKLLHLIVISKDLSYFNHIHPEHKGGGVFEIDNVFPAGGEYRFIADFKPADGDSMTKMEWLKVEGKPSEAVPVVPDEKLVRVIDGKRVTLTLDSLEAKKETKLTFTLAEESSNQPITDLQQYLGAIGHVVILSEDGERYVHVHAEEGQGTGPDAVFEASFPRSGVYKIWGQFQRNGQVFTAAYVVKVP